jgi:hypothetical protein
MARLGLALDFPESFRIFPLNLRRAVWVLAVVACAAMGAATAEARGPKLAKYPLRFHVLAADTGHRMQKMSPGEAVACDAVDDMLASADPGQEAPFALTGVSSDPCALHAGSIGGRLLELQQEESFAGEGRGDLVSPPRATQGVSFEYGDCMRVRVLSGFASLPARWKKPGETLEVLVPSDDIPVRGREVAPVRCSFKVTLHDFVYLLLPAGKLIEVSQEVYWAKPGLRVFLSGGTQVVLRREEVAALKP